MTRFWSRPELVRYLKAELPVEPGHVGQRPFINVFPRGADFKHTANYNAHHYEISASYANMGADLTGLAAALAAIPGAHRVTIYRDDETGLDPTWPIRYRSVIGWRPQVLALIHAQRVSA